MRASLKQSIKDALAGEDAFRYPKGSIVLCNACAVPVAKLDHGIGLSDKAGRMVNAFKPLTSADVDVLASREDIDAGVRVWATSLTPEGRQAYLAKLHEFKTGDPMTCPTCGGCFVQVLSVERHEVLDRAYVIELVTLPPQGQRVVPVRGRKISPTGDWLHAGAEVIH